MAVQYPTSPFGMEGTSGSPGIDLYPRLVGKDIYYQNVNQKANNSLYPILTGVGQKSGAAVTNHPSHNHQGGIKGEFIEKCTAGGNTSRPIAVTGDISTVSNSLWINMHPSPVGDKSHMLLLGPPGCDSMQLSFYAINDWSSSNDCELAQIEFAFLSYGVSSDNNVTTAFPNCTYAAQMYYGSQLNEMTLVSFDVSGLSKCSDSGPTHKPSLLYGTLCYRILNFNDLSDTGHIYVYGPAMRAYRKARI